VDEQQILHSAVIREEQDSIIEEFSELWQNANKAERKQFPFRIVRNTGGQILIRDDKDRIVAEIQLLGGIRRCLWVRSLADLRKMSELIGEEDE
jgi:hypothetical protein